MLRPLPRNPNTVSHLSFTGAQTQQQLVVHALKVHPQQAPEREVRFFLQQSTIIIIIYCRLVALSTAQGHLRAFL